jgi:catechol 2,3-dioxygenase-like lactoylglutathione lyase family enzyme
MVETRLEVVVLPVSDVDRAKRFYESLGWRLDADFAAGDGFRVVQLTPAGSPFSIIFGTGVLSQNAARIEGLHLAVTDIETARAELVAAGVEVSDVFQAMPRSPRSPIPMAMVGGCRRSPPAFRGASIRRRRCSAPQASWRALFGERRQPTASTRRAPVRPTRIGPIGTPNSSRPSKPVRNFQCDGPRSRP